MQGHRDSNHHTRTSSLKKEGQYLKKTTYIGDIQVMVHTAKNHCKSVPTQLHHQVRSSAPRIINSSSISTLFQYRLHKTGFITTSPVQPPIAAFPPSQTMCDSLSHKVDPNSLFKIVHSQLLLNFYKSKFPSFSTPFTSKFNT